MNQPNPKYKWRSTMFALLIALSLLSTPLAPPAQSVPPQTTVVAESPGGPLGAQPASAQTEICGNGIDDDGDGYIDSYDPDCYAASACSVPASLASFGMGLDWQSSNNVWRGSTPTVADLDGDGLPEILVTSNSLNGYYVYEGDSSNQSSATLDYQNQCRY